jgi:hypothetical protein
VIILLLTFACGLAVDGRTLAPSLDWDTLGGLPAAAQFDTSGRPPMNPPQTSGQWLVVSGQKDTPSAASSKTTDHRPLTTDHPLLTTDHRPLTTDHPLLTTDHRPLTTNSLTPGCRDWYRGARDAFMAEPGGPPLWILMTLNDCPACEELEHDAAWVRAMRRRAHFAVFVYDEDPDFGNAIVSNFSAFPFLVRFRWDAGQIRSDVLTDPAAIRRLSSCPKER